MGVVVQALEAYLGGELPVSLVPFLGCSQHTSWVGGRSTCHARLLHNSSSVALAFSWEAVVVEVPRVLEGVALVVLAPD